MQADGRIGLYTIGGRDGCSPIDFPAAFADDIFYVFFDADEDAVPQMLARNDPAKSRVFPYCLGDVNGPATFYHNYDPYTSSLLKPSTEFDFVQRSKGRDYRLSDAFRPVREAPVELQTLDSLHLLDDPAVAAPAIITIDTQGTELAILRGGRDLITEHTMAIVTEAEFVRLYEGQPLFGDLCAALDELGFMFVDFTAGPFKLQPFFAPLGMRSRPMVGFCDALFLRKPSAVSQPLHLAQLAFVAHLYAQAAYGFHCLDLLKKADPALDGVPAGRAYRRFLLELDAARQTMPVTFGLNWMDLYPTYERSNERFDNATPFDVVNEHLSERYAAMRTDLVRRQDEFAPLLSFDDSPIETVMRAFGLDKHAQACKDWRIHEVTEMFEEVGLKIVRETVPVEQRDRN
ncbi:MAG TPA: FkbM family methyltransferase [Candidatus Lustribacter sp.]|nr:FkbM family methyltransferase [Candidatus Lustribacter sp.]